MKYYIISGEASGDLHASNLMMELKKLDDKAEFRFWGGDRMQAQGGTLIKHYKELAFMGFIEVLLNLRTILKNMRFCKQDIDTYKPDALILVDYPGFNLRIAEFAKEAGYKVFYYISPQVWAWKESRVKKMRRDIDNLYVILPFEKEYFAKHHIDAEFVGHPLIDAIEQRKAEQKDDFRKKNNLSDKPIIAILPGSRKQEISKMLPIMLSVEKDYPDYQFVVAGAPSQDISFYESIVGDKANIVEAQTYPLLENAHAALVTSGTATLETALFKVPEVVCYKGSSISYQIAKRLVKIKYISLVNLVMDKELVKELIQAELNTKNLKLELDKLIAGDRREKMLAGYEELEQKLGGSGASANTANSIYKTLSNEI